MRFTLDEREYEISLDDLTTEEAELVEKHTGLGIWAFGRGIANGHPAAVHAVVFLAKRQAGEAIRWQDLDKIRIVPIAVQLTTSLLDESGMTAGSDGGGGGAAVPDPTPAPETPASDAGTTPGGASPSTSGSSPPSSGGHPPTSPGSPLPSSTTTPSGSNAGSGS